MASVKLTVLGFAAYELTAEEALAAMEHPRNESFHLEGFRFDGDEDDEVSAVVLRETKGDRYIVIQLDPVDATILYRLHTEPGEPYIYHEQAKKVFDMAQVKVREANITEEALDPPIIFFSTMFEQFGKVWEEYMYAVDMIGFAIAAGIPVTIDEELFGRLSKNVLPLERLGLHPSQAQSLASKGPSGKLTDN